MPVKNVHRIALIACDHGLGHVRRCYLIALALSRRGAQVDVFAPREKFEAIRRAFPKDPNIRNIEFSTQTSQDEILRWNGPKRLFGKNQSSLSIYDRLVSDNLPEVLEFRPDTILSGHFLWHNVFEKTPQEYKDYVRNLIRQHKPVFISASLFACEEIQKAPHYCPTGLYALSLARSVQVKPTKNRQAILLAGGSTKAAGTLEKIIPAALDLCCQAGGRLIIDPGLSCEVSKMCDKIVYPSVGLEEANYSQSMYSQIRLGLIRPGVGTLTDLLRHGAMPVCIYETTNSEMSWNAKAVARSGLGLDWTVKNESLSTRLFLREAWNLAPHFQQRIKEINFSGAEQAASIILES